MIDGIGRKIEVLRVSVTDRCNLRCVYCMPETGVPFLAPEFILRFEEIIEVVRVAISLGINRIRLTGGEPMVRSGIVDLVRALAALPGIVELAMTTNGSLLAGKAKALADAGLNRVNISLDTMDPEVYRKITRGGDLTDVLNGIEAAQAAGLIPVKLNIVVPDDDDSGARQVEAYARKMGLVTRRIRKMDIRRGVFSPVENSDRGICSVCNRLRLSSDGFIRPCLFSDLKFSVRELGARDALHKAAKFKPKQGMKLQNAYMFQIGG